VPPFFFAIYEQLTVGHEKGDHPWCRQPDGSWVADTRAALDLKDPKNVNRLAGIKKGKQYIDRHEYVPT